VLWKRSRAGSDLEADDRKMAQKLAKAQGDKKQMSLFGDLAADEAEA
jgi:hypothetical protein